MTKPGIPVTTPGEQLELNASLKRWVLNVEPIKLAEFQWIQDWQYTAEALNENPAGELDSGNHDELRLTEHGIASEPHLGLVALSQSAWRFRTRWFLHQCFPVSAVWGEAASTETVATTGARFVATSDRSPLPSVRMKQRRQSSLATQRFAGGKAWFRKDFYRADSNRFRSPRMSLRTFSLPVAASRTSSAETILRRSEHMGTRFNASECSVFNCRKQKRSSG